MSFNFSTKFDFLPKLFIGQNQLEVVQNFKLLGIIICSDLKWHEHTSYIVKKAKQRLWFLRRLSRLGASYETLLEHFHLMIRSVLETGAPVFTAGLNKGNITDIEDVQRGAFKIILRGKYKDYENALLTLGAKSLEDRRTDICLKFAKKCTSHPKMKHLFQMKEAPHVCPNPVPEGHMCSRTRGGNIFFEPQSTNNRGYNNPINFLIRLLNNDIKE